MVMKIYETMDGKGGWVGVYMKGYGNVFAQPGQHLWVPVKKFLWFWVRDRSKTPFFDWPNMFREKEKR